MLYSEFRANFITELGRNSTQVDSLADTWVNATIKEAYRKYSLWLSRQRWERDTSDGKRSYPFPELITIPELLYYQDNTDGSNPIWKPVEVKGDRIAMQMFSPSDTGPPKLVVLGNKAIHVYPLPDATYTLGALIKAYEPDLAKTNASGQESPLINEAYAYVMAGAKTMGFSYLKLHEDKAEAEKDLQKAGMELKRQNARRLLSAELTIWPSSNARTVESRS